VKRKPRETAQARRTRIGKAIGAALRQTAQEPAGTLQAAGGTGSQAEAPACEGGEAVQPPKRGRGRPRRITDRRWRTVCFEASTWAAIEANAKTRKLSASEYLRELVNAYLRIPPAGP
jgi:hypothetical protein